MPKPRKKGGTKPPEYLPEGTMLEGKYRIIHPLAEGGMGIVYKAEHELMRKVVAIKRLHRDLLNFEQVVQRFEREAQAAAKIDHLNVCAVTDCGRDETGAFFIVMELLEGESIQDIIDREGRIEIPRLLRIAVQTCAGLQKAHSMGVVHRDLKPENIMLVTKDKKEDIVKIMDFGIAKMVADDTPTSSLTQAGMIFGTPHFLSPEQAAGDTIDHRSDLYSLGVIVFYMATGQYPFDEETVGALLRKHISAPPPLLSEVAPNIKFPDGLQPLLSRLLAKNPEDRYPDAKVLMDHFSVLLESVRIQSEDSLDYESSVQVHVTDEISEVSSLDEAVPGQPIPPDMPFHATAPVSPAEEAPDARQYEAMQIEHPYQHTPIPDSQLYDKISSKWQENKKLRILIISLSIFSVAVLLVVILVYTKIFQKKEGDYEETSPERIQAALEQKRALFNEMPEITKALSMTVEKKYDEALEALAPLESDPQFNKNPHYYYHLSNIQVKTDNVEEGMLALENCLELEPDYSYDPMVVELLVEGLRNEKAFELASILLINHVNVVMKDTLEKIAREDENDEVRRVAIKAMKRKNLIEKLKPWKQYAIDLANPDSTCQSKKDSFSKIQPINEKELLPTLELLMIGKRCGDKKCSICIGRQLEEKRDALSGKQSESP